MLFIPKSDNTRNLFKRALNGHQTYQALTGSGLDRDAVKLVLLNEQGCLCPFCEKRLEIGTATIEHFQPQSIYPHLQLDYFNLFACCHVCNQKKDDHLIPSYIFDPRSDSFNLTHLILNRHEDFKFFYHNIDQNNCYLQKASLLKIKKLNPQYFSDVIFYNTIELLDLNNSIRLGGPRAVIRNRMLQRMETLNDAGLIRLYFSHYNKTTVDGLNPDVRYLQYEEHISLKLYLIAETIRKRGVNLQALNPPVV